MHVLYVLALVAISAHVVMTNDEEEKKISADITETVASLVEIVESIKHDLSQSEDDHMQLGKLVQEMGVLHHKADNITKSVDEFNFNLNRKIDDVRTICEVIFDEQQSDKKVEMCSKQSGCKTKHNNNVVNRYECYKLEMNNHAIKVTWHEAVQRCHDLGGFLAEPQDIESVNFFEDYIQMRAPFSTDEVDIAVWFGASDAQTEGSWTWVTSGKSMSASAWLTEYPKGGSHDDDCAEIQFSRIAKWRDQDCSVKQGFVCQKNADSCDDWQFIVDS